MRVGAILLSLMMMLLIGARAGEPTADTVIISLALNWEDLWHEGASLEEVDQKTRDENINEVIIEIGNKMKRRNRVTEMMDFIVKKV